ncbi:MAG TPA: sulfotransferase domain-containing protein [Ideonella sp.]|nr:sulfotransferase domain-containing protein [Ideonella sp.]
MQHLTYRNVPFELADDGGATSFFVFGVRKSGSSILNSMVAALASHRQLPFLDIGGALFAAGVKVSDWQHDAALGGLLRRGNVYGGFRNFPAGLVGHVLYREAPKVLLVRDPRDALVSEYFSNAYSHSLPQAGEGREQMLDLRREALQSPIDRFVVERAPAMAQTLREYRVLLADPRVRVFRYEDVITEKRRLLADVSAHFGWAVAPGYVDKIMSWADVLPDAEDPTRFVRKVLPGDHLSKLTPAMIARLDDLLADEMKAFGYARSVPAS